MRVEYAVGCHLHRLLPNIDKDWLRQPGSDQPGVILEYFAGPGLTSTTRHVEVIEAAEASWFGNFVEGVDARSSPPVSLPTCLYPNLAAISWV